MTGGAIALRVREMDNDAEMNATRAGLLAKRFGFMKKRIPKDGRHVVVWDDELAGRMAYQYGMTLPPPNPSHPSSMSPSASEPSDPLSPSHKPVTQTIPP